MFPLVQKGKEALIIIVIFLCLQHIVEGAGDIRFCICVRHSDTNDGVSLALPQMEDLKIPSEDL